MDFFELLTGAHPSLACFDYDHYPASFKAFEDAAKPWFDALEPSRLDAEAEEILREAEARWKARPFWERAELMRKDKTALALFFAPAAARHSETTKAFAERLQERWNERFPRARFLAGDYEKIMLGFDKDFLGIKLRKSKNRG